MAFRLNEIRDNKGATHSRKVVGRGIGSGLGKTSGRGGKGQTARAGVSLNGFEGGQMPVYRRVPKRGFHNPGRVDLYELHFRKLAVLLAKGALKSGETVDTNFLIKSGMMPKYLRGVSLIASGDISVPLNFRVTRASKKAKELVEKAGGTVTIE